MQTRNGAGARALAGLGKYRANILHRHTHSLAHIAHTHSHSASATFHNVVLLRSAFTAAACQCATNGLLAEQIIHSLYAALVPNFDLICVDITRDTHCTFIADSARPKGLSEMLQFDRNPLQMCMGDKRDIMGEVGSTHQL